VASSALPRSEDFPRYKARFQRKNRFVSTDLFWWGAGCHSVAVAEIHRAEKDSPSPHSVLIMENNAGCFAKY